MKKERVLSSPTFGLTKRSVRSLSAPARVAVVNEMTVKHGTDLGGQRLMHDAIRKGSSRDAPGFWVEDFMPLSTSWMPRVVAKLFLKLENRVLQVKECSSNT
jgi:hypothetical protein